MKYLEDNALLEYWRQHTGHGIGLRNHEAPFLDVGDHMPVEPGMVFTIEPGLYSDTIGGFRHSDTVAVTPDGIDVLTEYPRDLRSLTIPDRARSRRSRCPRLPPASSTRPCLRQHAAILLRMLDRR